MISTEVSGLAFDTSGFENDQSFMKTRAEILERQNSKQGTLGQSLYLKRPTRDGRTSTIRIRRPSKSIQTQADSNVKQSTETRIGFC